MSNDESVSACTIVLILSSSTVFSVQSGAFFCVRWSVCFCMEASMHGSSGGTVVINISPMSEKEAENERLRDIARHSGQITSPGGHKGPSDGGIVRDSDVILYDHMGGESESSLFSADRLPEFARAMGANEDEIGALQAEMVSSRIMLIIASLAVIRCQWSWTVRWSKSFLRCLIRTLTTSWVLRWVHLKLRTRRRLHLMSSLVVT